MSKRTRPDGQLPVRPSRRTAAAAVAAPSVTSLPSCGQPVTVSPTSRSEAAPREEMSDAPEDAQDVGRLLLEREPGEVRRVHARQEPVEERPVRLEVEALDVEDARGRSSP